MKISLLLAAAATAACASMAGPAALASADDTYVSAADTIAGLQAQGYTVSIDRVGSAPLESCSVMNVRNPQENWVTRRDRHGDRYEVLISKTIIVSLAC